MGVWARIRPKNTADGGCRGEAWHGPMSIWEAKEECSGQAATARNRTDPLNWLRILPITLVGRTPDGELAAALGAAEPLDSDSKKCSKTVLETRSTAATHLLPAPCAERVCLKPVISPQHAVANIVPDESGRTKEEDNTSYIRNFDG